MEYIGHYHQTTSAATGIAGGRGQGEEGAGGGRGGGCATDLAPTVFCTRILKLQIISTRILFSQSQCFKVRHLTRVLLKMCSKF